jgi:hypothetical protein
VLSVRRTRRWFLKVAGVSLGALGFHEQSAAVAAGAADSVTTVYYLDPNWGQAVPECSGNGQLSGHSCQGCTSCQRHASHKRFASAEAADRMRAHPRCKCLVRSTQIGAREYLALFGSATGDDHRDAFDDRRDTPYTLKRIYLPAV